MIDPYKTLGVSKSASQDEIRKAYRKLARQYHPDMNQGKTDAEAKFRDISAAYELIGSEDKRKKFDAGEMEQTQNEAAWRDYWANQNAQQGPFYSQARGRDRAGSSGGGGGRYSFGGGTGGFDEDILRSIFENQYRGGNAGPDVGMGVDEHFQTEISFEDAALGAEREITLPNGRHLKVKIPAGVKDGQTLKLKGQSSAQSAQGLPHGDIYIALKVRSSPRYQLDGTDIESDLPISLAEAVLGGEVKARVIDGNLLVRIPEGANTGQRLKIKGRGAMNPKTGIRGDHYFALKVMLPEKIDDELREAIRVWSGSHEHSPREEAEAT